MTVSRFRLATCSLGVLGFGGAVAAAQDVVTSHVLGTAIREAAPLAEGAVAAVGLDNSTKQLHVVDRLGNATNTLTLPNPSGFGEFHRVVADGVGGAFVLVSDAAGVLGGPSLGGRDAVVLRLDTTGQVLSARRHGGSGNEMPRAILADGAGGYFIAGDTWSADFGTPSGGPRDAFVARVDAAGTVQWVYRHGTQGLHWSMAALTPDGAGGVLGGGAAEDFNQSPVASGGFAVRLNGAGQQVSIALQGFQGAVAAIAGAANGAYMTVELSSFGGSFLALHGAAGGVSLLAFGEPYALVRADDGTIFVGGSASSSQPTARLQARDPLGALLWERDYPTPANLASTCLGLAVDEHQGVYLAGAGDFGTTVVSNWLGQVTRVALGTIGDQFCAGRPNSTGNVAETRATGSLATADEALTLFTDGLPVGTFGFYVLGQMPGFVQGAGGGQGDLCLGSPIGRLNRSGELEIADAFGLIHLNLDLDDLPTPTVSVAAMAGETWYFQAWYRDVNPTQTSNLSSTVRVVFQ